VPPSSWSEIKPDNQHIPGDNTVHTLSLTIDPFVCVRARERETEHVFFGWWGGERERERVYAGYVTTLSASGLYSATGLLTKFSCCITKLACIFLFQCQDT
jgi:hypothetical protein